jgi:Peptidase M50B-like
MATIRRSGSSWGMRRDSAVPALLIATALTLVVYLVPFAHILAWPLILVSTLMHELGHGLASLLCGGRFDNLSIWSDASGVATHYGSFSRGQLALIAAAGPLGPPMSALALFVAARNARGARIGLALLAAFLGLVCLIWVRNLFGFCFVALFATTLALIAWLARPRAAQIVCAFLGIQLSLSVFSRGDYLFTSRAETAVGIMPSDTAQIAQALFLPYWFWGGVIGLISLAILAIGLWLFARDR